jgi:hypothetical protein
MIGLCGNILEVSDKRRSSYFSFLYLDEHASTCRIRTLPSAMESKRPQHFYVRTQSQISAYDEETLRLEKYGGWISRTLTVLRVIARFLTFTSAFGPVFRC